MGKIKEFFEEFSNSKNALSSSKKLEVLILELLIKKGFEEVSYPETTGRKDFFRKKIENFNDLEKSIFNINNEQTENKTQFNNTFIYQPFGSQEYPDFLLIGEKFIYPLEAKSSDKKKPMLNSGLIRPTGLYIVRLAKKFSFFKGSEFINKEEYTEIINYFDKASENDKKFNETSKNKNFKVYTRAAFDCTTLFNPIEIANKTEKNLIDFVE